MLFAYFVYITLSANSLVEALCLGKNLCSWENQKRRKVLVKKKQKTKKKKKKKGPKEKEKKENNLSRKGKNPLWKQLVLADLHASVQISNKGVAVKPKIVIHKIKKEVSFHFYKYQPWYKIINNRLKP